jgi:O-antigen/teichoic acid export membrane protein
LLPNQSKDAVAGLQLFSLALLPMAVFSVSSAGLRGLESMKAFTWVNAFQGLILVLVGWVLVTPGSSMVAVAWLLLVVNTTSAALAAVLLARAANGRLQWKISSPQVASVLVAAAPIAALGFVGALYQRAGVFILGTLSGAAATGIFSAALRVVEAAKLGHFAMLGALFPTMARAAERPNEGSRLLITRSLAGLLVLAVVLATALFFAAEPLLPAVFGEDFEASAAELRVLSWLLIPMSVTHYYSLRLLAAKREREILLSLLASLAVLVAIALGGVAGHGIHAVSLGLLAGESLQAGMMIYYWRRVN